MSARTWVWIGIVCCLISCVIHLFMKHYELAFAWFSSAVWGFSNIMLRHQYKIDD